jgi:site-specific recombinase XerD
VAVTAGDEDPRVIVELARTATLSPERAAELEAKLARAVAATRAPATLRAYRADWADFTIWCRTLGVAPLPAAPEVLAAYLSELAQPGDDRPPAAVATIERRLSAVTQAHRVAGLASPRSHPLVAETLRGVRRLLGVAPKGRKAGALTADLQAAVAAIDLATLSGLRDRALLLLGFAGGMRRSELVGLDVDDLEAAPEGYVIRLRSSKTDQEAAGRAIPIVYGTDPGCCPVRAVRAWTTAAGINAGPLFRPVNRHGTVLPRRLSAQSVALIVKAHMGRLGHLPTDFAGHSLRRGHATSAARGGAPERTIMATTGHRSTRTVRTYIEEGQLFDDPSGRYLGL